MRAMGDISLVLLAESHPVVEQSLHLFVILLVILKQHRDRLLFCGILEVAKRLVVLVEMEVERRGEERVLVRLHLAARLDVKTLPGTSS
jgi:hypothetical protein